MVFTVRALNLCSEAFTLKFCTCVCVWVCVGVCACAYLYSSHTCVASSSFISSVSLWPLHGRNLGSEQFPVQHSRSSTVMGGAQPSPSPSITSVAVMLGHP